jgi:alpha-glucosidase
VIPPALVQDPWEKNVPSLGLGRDPERTPMHWSDAHAAGFTTGDPWLPLAADYRTVNVAVQRRDPKSLLTLYRRLTALRRASPALCIGSYEPLEYSGDVLMYGRAYAGQRRLIGLNLSPRAQRCGLVSSMASGQIVLSTELDRTGESLHDVFDLRPHEGVIIACS